MAWWVPVAMAAAGYAAGEQEKKEQKKEAARQRALEAETAKWSPWTGLAPKRVGEPSATAAPMQGALTGLSMWQNYEAAKNQKEMNDAMVEMMKAKNQSSPAAQPAPQGQPVNADNYQYGDQSPWNPYAADSVSYQNPYKMR